MTVTDTAEAATAESSTTEVCALERLTPDRGTAALVDGQPVALFRLSDGNGSHEVVAVDHIDPFHGVGVIARGLVGSVGERTTVASPLHKQRFDLHTGECLDDPDVRLRTWAVEVVDGAVHVRAR